MISSRTRRCGLALGVALCFATGFAFTQTLNADEAAPQALALTGDVRGTHDPALAKEGDRYYVFATGASRPAGQPPADRTLLPQIQIRCSADLHQWTRCGAVFPELPAWIRELSPKTTELWAPDVSFFDGVFHLYYAFSVFGKNTSGIGLATNVTLDSASPEYKWVDRGLVLRSGAGDDFNAIDPNLVLDAAGDPWLAFGSFWSGIKMRRLDRKTGLPSASDKRLYSLASRGGRGAVMRDANLPPSTEAIEAPFILPHEGYFYLFVSWDLCCRGAKSTYHERVGRSRSVTGPYVDRSGTPMMLGGGTEVLTANDAWRGPGGASLLHLAGRNPQELIAFHAYSAVTGAPSLQISTIRWKDGWPSAAVSETAP